MKKEIITAFKKNSPDIINEWSSLVHKSTIHYKDLSLKETKQSVGRHYDAVIEVLDKENYDALNDFLEYLALFFSEKFSVKVLTDTDSISTYLDSAYCLLIDVDFVNKTGFELPKSIKSSLPSIKIVVMYKASQKNIRNIQSISTILMQVYLNHLTFRRFLISFHVLNTPKYTGKPIPNFSIGYNSPGQPCISS